MKKIFVSIIALLALSFCLSANKVKFSRDIDVSYGNKLFSVEPISYIGYGYHLKNDEMKDEMNAFNSEFFINIMELSLRPSSWLGINLGVDYDLDVYRLDKQSIWQAQANDKVWVSSLSMMPSYKAVKSSVLRVHTFSVPLSFEFNAGKCAFRLGAAGEYNLPATVKNRIAEDKGTTKQVVKGIKTQNLSYSAFGAISYGGLGVYVRYRPSYQFDQGYGPHFKSLTIGAVIGLGF